MIYRVRFDPATEKALLALPNEAREAIMLRVTALADDPRPPTTQMLTGTLRGLRKMRVGDYRVAYAVDDKANTITVAAVGHRSRFYQDASRRGR
jgi:mRNA interferase RelE/StbE